MSNQRKALGSALESRVVERAQAAGLCASRQPGSGVFKDFPSDVRVEGGLVECKVRSAGVDAKGQRYLRIDLDWLRKVKEEAGRSGLEWAAVVVNPKGSRSPMVLLDLEFFLSLLVEKSPQEVK
jgi:hypothetical protein